MGVRQAKPKSDQLCWQCARTYGGCGWSKNFSPVEGWVARKICHREEGAMWESYQIIACPRFLAEERL